MRVDKRLLVGPDHPSEPPTSEGPLDISLPGIIPDAEAAIAAGDILIVTARLATFDPDVIGPTAPPAVDPYEYVFGTTDVVVGGLPTGLGAPELTITTSAIPEPSLILVFMGFTAWVVCRELWQGRRAMPSLVSTP